MAIKTTKPTGSKRKKKTVSNPFKSEKFRFIFGIFVLLVAAYLLVSFISFLFHGAADQSRLDLPWNQLVLDSDIQVGNKAGKTGAWLAEVIMNRGFGFASFLFIYLLIITGFKIMKIHLVKYRRSLVYSVVLILWISLAAGFIFPKTDAASFIYPGGRYGFILSNWLSSLVGNTGLALLLFISVLTLIVIRFEKAYSFLSGFLKWERKNIHEEEDTREELQSTVQVTDNSIAKVIGADDTVQALFEPDAHENELFELENTREPQAEIPDIKKEKLATEELELMVHERKAEEEVDEEYSGDGMEEYDPTLELSKFRFPTLEILEDHRSGNAEVSNEELIANKNKIVETLRHYKIEITKIRATIGPTITLYEIVPAPGIRIAKIKNLEDDIALSLAALGIRIIAPIPGRGTIGIEVPNQNPEIVSMRSILSSRKFQESTADLPIALGKTISNETYMFDLAKMPHILVAGATGQGKSVGINVIITSLLYKKHPSQLKFVFIDPKKVELNLYSVLEKHYLAKLPNDDEPVITDIQKVKYTLNSLNVEMDQR